jgi:hypothetical protein
LETNILGEVNMWQVRKTELTVDGITLEIREPLAADALAQVEGAPAGAVLGRCVYLNGEPIGDAWKEMPARHLETMFAALGSLSGEQGNA